MKASIRVGQLMSSLGVKHGRDPLGALRVLERQAEDLARQEPENYRLKAAAIGTLESAGYTAQEISSVVFLKTEQSISVKPSADLDADASDRVYRLARIVLLANRIFGEATKAFIWLRRGNKNLNGSTPIANLKTETGSRLVEELLIRIDHGIAA